MIVSNGWAGCHVWPVLSHMSPAASVAFGSGPLVRPSGPLRRLPSGHLRGGSHPPGSSLAGHPSQAAPMRVVWWIQLPG